MHCPAAQGQPSARSGSTFLHQPFRQHNSKNLLNQDQNVVPLTQARWFTMNVHDVVFESQ
jgi:hypothetical protein